MDAIQRKALDRVTFRAEVKSPYGRIVDLLEAREIIERHLGLAGRKMARETSWQAVGDAFGISKQAAWEKFAEPHMKQQFRDAQRARIKPDPERKDDER